MSKFSICTAVLARPYLDMHKLILQMSKSEKDTQNRIGEQGKTAKRFCKEVLFASFSFKKRKKQNTAQISYCAKSIERHFI